MNYRFRNGYYQIYNYKFASFYQDIFDLTNTQNALRITFKFTKTDLL